jgi:hypothetical protein
MKAHHGDTNGPCRSSNDHIYIGIMGPDKFTLLGKLNNFQQVCLQAHFDLALFQQFEPGRNIIFALLEGFGFVVTRYSFGGTVGSF